MPSLIVKIPSLPERRVPLVKPFTSVGRSPDSDVVVDDRAVPEFAFQIRSSGGAFIVVASDKPVEINGKRRDEHELATGDVIALGGTELRFQGAETAPATGKAAGDGSALDEEALRRLVEFGEQLLGRYELSSLLETMMDQVVELTRADKGLLILLEGNEARVKVARKLAHQNIEDPEGRISDSIIAKVLKTRRPVIVSDALSDSEFGSSASVVNLKLMSVMCVPLTEKGEIIGLLYVGNDSVAHLFEPRSLDLLTVYAGQASLILRNALLVNELRVDNAGLRKQLEDKRFGEIVGSSAGMRDVYRKIDKIAGTDISVLITGETGTGKEMIARELHQRSTRAKGPFITINCGAIPENLLESELFGHVRGAFTGAVNTRIGRFQAANGGTLFLDEIGEMPLQLQVKILRALQERQVTKVGDSRSETVDIRVLAATNKTLEDEIKKGAFREDLYYRLNVVTLKLPPLRERGDDVVAIARFFLNKQIKELDSKVKGLSPNATIALKKYAWPGNVRELENRMKKAVVLAERAFIGPEDLDLQPENLDPIMPLALAKEEFQKRYINEILERNNGNRTKSAKDLGVDPRTVFRHLEKQEAERQGRPYREEPDDAPPDSTP